MMAMTANRIEELGIVDQVIDEPLGGAHRDIDATAANIKRALVDSLRLVGQFDVDQMIERRYQRYMSYGVSA